MPNFEVRCLQYPVFRIKHVVFQYSASIETGHEPYRANHVQSSIVLSNTFVKIVFLNKKRKFDAGQTI